MKIVLMIICQIWDEAAGRDMVVFIVEAGISEEWSSLYILLVRRLVLSFWQNYLIIDQQF